MVEKSGDVLSGGEKKRLFIKIGVCGALPRAPLKPFLEEGFKNPKNFKGIWFDRVSFTPNKIGGCCIGARLSINAYEGAPYPARSEADTICL